MANQRNQRNQPNPTRLEVLQAHRGGLVTTISNLEWELQKAEADLDRANRAAEADRRAEIEDLNAQQTGYEWAARGAAFAHQEQTLSLIRRKQRRPFLRFGIALLILAALLLYTKSVLLLGVGVLVVFFLWRVMFNRRRLMLRRMDVRDLGRRLVVEPRAARTLRREAERTSDEARRLQRSDPMTREQRSLTWQVQTLKNSLRANRNRLRELDEELALYQSYP